jgi:hypothetical protein
VKFNILVMAAPGIPSQNDGPPVTQFKPPVNLLVKPRHQAALKLVVV